MIVFKTLKFLYQKKRLLTKSEVLSYLKIRRKVMPLPYYAQIEPTTYCNFDCIICVRKTFNPSILNRHLTLAEFKIILNQIPSLKYIKLQGIGEPFLNPDLGEILKFGKQRKIIFKTISNGSVLKTNKHLIQYFDYLTISFDSANKDNFEKIRRGSNFDVILENIKEIVDYKIKNKLKTKIGINTVVTHLNYQEIPQIIKLALSLRTDYIRFVEVKNCLTLIEQQFLKEQEFIKKSRRYIPKVREIIEEERRKIRGFSIGFLSSENRKSICKWPFYMVYITVDGFVTPCCILPNPEVFNFGNIYQEDFKKIWNGEKYQKFRESLIKNQPNFVCDHCPGA